MKYIKTYETFLNENYENKVVFSENVKKWSHVWTPREDCNIMEKNIINSIFNDQDLEWKSNYNCFSISNLIIENDYSINKLKRLTFLPPLIVYKFDCSFNSIESLEGGPKIAIDYFCNNNKLKDLRGAPLECDYFSCNRNPLEIFIVYAKPYNSYNTPNEEKLAFVDPNKWTKEEYEAHLDNINTSDTYL